MIDPKNISTVSDLRFKTSEVFKKAIKAPVFLFHRSNPKGVLLSIAEYQNIIDRLEDHYDSVQAKDYEKEDKTKIDWIPFSTIKKIVNG